MNIGEAWVAHLLFPWIVMILAFWVGCSTILLVRIWVKIRRLENQRKIVAKRIKPIRGKPVFKRIRREKKCLCKLCSEKSRVRIEEPKPAAIEEENEDGEHFSVVESEDKERAVVGSV